MVAYPQIADQYPAAEYALTGTTGITLLDAFIANRNSARCDIAVIGDSITEGQGATAFTSRWIAAANRAIRAQYPTTAHLATGGIGFIPMQSTGENSYTWPVVLATGAPAPYTGVGPVREIWNMFAASSYTYTAPSGTTSVKIMWFDSALPGSFTYKVNAGGTTTVTAAGTLTDTLTAGITMTGGDVLTIAWASGNAFVDGIIHYAGDETSGVTFNGCGHYGWLTGTGGSGWLQPDPNGFDWRPAIALVASAAIAIYLGTNDAAVSAGNLSAATFGSNLTSLISYLRGNASLASLPVLLVAGYAPNETVADAGGWAAYVAALRAVAVATANCHVIDLNYRLPSVASNFDAGALYADTLHPANLGHALIGEIAAAGLRVA